MNLSHIEMPSEIRSYKQRSGRLGPVAAAAYERQWPTLGFTVPRNPHREPMPPLDLKTFFGNDRPVVLEIGFGMGDAAIGLASEDPETNLLACDVHVPGIALLCKRVEDSGLTNIRIAYGDAIDLLRDHLIEDSLAGTRVFFPDPWPKKKHHKRRIINADFLTLLAARLRVGGVLHFATDWEEYAEHTREAIEAHPAYELLDSAPARPTTQFERRGWKAGRHSHDIAARCVKG